MPGPFGRLCSERLFQAFPVKRQFKSPRLTIRIPPGDPVDRSNEDAIRAGRWYFDSCGCILHRTTETVCQQVGRPHIVDKLSVELPTAVTGETLRLNQHSISSGNLRDQAQANAKRHHETHG